jgi:hypothetical protein
MEMVEGLMLKPDNGKIIPSVAYEEELIRSLPNYLSALKSLDVGLPFIVFLTLVDVKGYLMATKSFFQEESFEIDRDILLLPEVIVDSYDIKPEVVLKPAFDAIWNACGFSNSLNYNDKGGMETKTLFPLISKQE